MPEKIKITKKEFEEMYQWDDEKEDRIIQKDNPDNANATFEEFTEAYDMKEYEEMRKKRDA